MLNQDNIKFLLIIFFITSISLSGEVEVKFCGNDYISNSIIENIFLNNEINVSIDKILKLYNNNGFPFIDITVDSVIQSGDKQIIFINIKENGKYNIYKIENKGSVSSYFLNNVCDLENKVFSLITINKEINRLKKYSFIDFNNNFSIKIANDYYVIIETYMKQKSVSYISGVIASDFDSILLAGFIDINLISPQGYGRKYSIHYDRFNKELSNLNFDIMSPYIFYTPFGIELSGAYTNIDTSLTKSNISFEIFYETNNILFSSGIGKNWNYYIYNNDSNSVYTNYKIRIKYSYNTNFYETSYNYFSAIEPYSFIDIKTYNAVELRNFFIGSYTIFHYLKTDFDSIGKYMKIPIGGTNSIKGYAENFIYAKDKLEEHLEFKYLFSENFNLGIFYDIGFFNIENNEKFYENYIFSYGPFFDIKNNKVSLKLYYGIGKDISYFNGRLHIIFNYLF